MPGATPNAAVDAFIDPIRESASCLSGSAHLTLSPKARGQVGETHSWTLNAAEGVSLIGGHRFKAAMHFETLDQGASRRDERFRVSTRAYLYAITNAAGQELIAAHWHPTGKSHVTFPHWHLGAAAISEEGVFLKRAHIPSPRVSFESMVRQVLDMVPGIEPCRDDWDTVLDRTEGAFEEFKSW